MFLNSKDVLPYTERIINLHNFDCEPGVAILFDIEDVQKTEKELYLNKSVKIYTDNVIYKGKIVEVKIWGDSFDIYVILENWDQKARIQRRSKVEIFL